MTIPKTKNEAAALRVVNRYRRQVDQMEDMTARMLAARYAILSRNIRKDLKSLKYRDPRNRPMIVRYKTDIQPVIEKRARTYAQEADEAMVSLAKRTARMGAEAADKSARKVVEKEARKWEKVSTAGLFSGPLFKASREALRRLPGAISERITDLVGQAVGMAEQGFDWLMSQIGEALGGLWSGLQRTVRTLAEQMFRRAQQEQAQRTPVTRWLRLANHETACLACLMLEGTIYDNREDFADHPNGRCTIMPIESGTHHDEHPGRDWLEQQDEETQRRILGKTRYEAWRNGEISLDDMVEVVNDPVYGPLPHVIQLNRLGLTPLK